jgi:type IV pilus assembly protein PilC
MAVRMIKVGELSGGMDTALRNVSYFYDREAKEMIEKIEPTIEPILTVVMGFVVGWVMLAVLGPIYDTIAQVQ